MRTLFYPLLIIFFSFIASKNYAQDPCAGKAFTYFFGCNGARHCSDDPNNSTLWGHVQRWPAGSTIAYCPRDMSDGCLVDNTCMKNCIDDAFRAWLSLCPTGTLTVVKDLQGSYPCCIEIRNTTSPSELQHNATTTIAEARVANNCFSASDPIVCQNFDGVKSRIFVNRTSQFLSDKVPLCPCPASPGCTVPKNKEIVDICRALYHEIGHIFGLLHTEEQGLLPCNANSSSQDDIMFWSDPGGCRSHDLTLNDKCYFTKLYCNGQLSVKNYSFATYKDSDFTIFPNPAKYSATIKFYSKAPDLTSFTIFDMLGREIRSYMFTHWDGGIQKELDLTGIHPGSYYIRLSNSTSVITKHLEIIN